MTKHYKYLITLFAAALLWGACSDDEVDYGTSGIKMEVPAAADITSTSAVLSTVFNIRDDVRYTSAGFCYSKTATPTIYNSTVKGSVTTEYYPPHSRDWLRRPLTMYVPLPVYIRETWFTHLKSALPLQRERLMKRSLLMKHRHTPITIRIFPHGQCATNGTLPMCTTLL